MNGKVLVAGLALFLLYAAVAEGMSLSQTASDQSCQCISTDSKFIPPRRIQDVTLTQSGPHCQNMEIIATLKDGREVCLEPTAPWVKLIVKAILDKAQANGETML
ncbi:interleukin-8-like [Pelodiscus sinensis]|uniref:interleukin-8-like n=1 Tax=Pelodiscus sinensis TaxID=13735 RepID=UPI0003C4CB7D|nr:interleukin-8-like [Pelodiscus sinensis]|eukprot:XP_006125460.1 interleukin-8-like [Pelodiscus sinensis]